MKIRFPHLFKKQDYSWRIELNSERIEFKKIPSLRINLVHFFPFRTNFNCRSFVISGHISVQRAILEVKKVKGYSESVAAFCEEAIVRRELSDNFCFYNKNYDSIKGAYDWAKKTLKDHRLVPKVNTINFFTHTILLSFNTASWGKYECSMLIF